MADNGPGHYAPKGAFQPVYADKFLVDGVWYITVVCPIHDLVDEEVTWEDAKTPHHAGTIADKRHLECNFKRDAEVNAQARKQEIENAKAEVDRAKVNVKCLREAVKEGRARREAISDPGEQNVHARELAILEEKLAAHEQGVKEATQRLKDTRAQNASEE